MIGKPIKKRGSSRGQKPVTLGDWSATIRKQGEESAKREVERVANTRRSGDALIAEAGTLTDADLLARLVHVAGLGDHNTKIVEISHSVRDALQAEVLRRLEKKG